MVEIWFCVLCADFRFGVLMCYTFSYKRYLLAKRGKDKCMKCLTMNALLGKMHSIAFKLT
jgi:hypothetical protein